MSLNIKKTDRILVVAPHPDDETIGCGGLLAMYGAQCDVLLLTDGRKGYSSADTVDEDALAETREKELHTAMEIAGVNKIEVLRITDGKAGENKETIMSFDISAYDLIFVPNRAERHKDHCVVVPIFEKMRRKQKSEAQIFEYEVWSPLAAPTHSLDISGTIGIKERMIQQYQSQIKYVDYTAMTIGLSRYRGAGFSAEYAEVFAYLPRKNVFKSCHRRIRKCLKKIYDKLKKH